MTVPTVLRGVWPECFCSMAMAGERPSMWSTLRLLHLADELPGVGAEAFDVAPLALGIDRVHGQRGLARSARPAADGQLVAGNIDVDVLEVVLPGAADLDEAGGVGVRNGRRRATCVAAGDG